jgi:hypothetical protein
MRPPREKKLVLVMDRKLSRARLVKMLSFTTTIPLDAEIWTWPTLAREPVIERI